MTNNKIPRFDILIIRHFDTVQQIPRPNRYSMLKYYIKSMLKCESYKDLRSRSSFLSSTQNKSTQNKWYN